MMRTEGTVIIAVEPVGRGQTMFLIKTNLGKGKYFLFFLIFIQEYQESFS